MSVKWLRHKTNSNNANATDSLTAMTSDHGINMTPVRQNFSEFFTHNQNLQTKNEVFQANTR